MARFLFPAAGPSHFVRQTEPPAVLQLSRWRRRPPTALNRGNSGGDDQANCFSAAWSKGGQGPVLRRLQDRARGDTEASLSFFQPVIEQIWHIFRERVQCRWN